jgi:hypothetical protein
MMSVVFEGSNQWWVVSVIKLRLVSAQFMLSRKVCIAGIDSRVGKGEGFLPSGPAHVYNSSSLQSQLSYFPLVEQCLKVP